MVHFKTAVGWVGGNGDKPENIGRGKVTLLEGWT